MRPATRPVLTTLSLLLLSGSALAADPAWTRVSEATLPAAGGMREIVPQKYVVHRADLAALREALTAAPLERAGRSPLVFSMPNPEGFLEDFKVVESPIMEPGLAAKFPEIRTYTAQGIDDPTASGRLDVTPAGFHGYILSARGTFLVDPYRRGDTSHYVTYWKKDYERTLATPFRCDVQGEAAPPATAPRTPSSVRPGLAPLAQGATLRTYRLAVAATGEYTQYHGGSVAAGLAAQVVAMNRVNAVYEREVDVRMVIVANNNLVIFVNPDTDPYTDGNPSALYNQNPGVLNSLIGSSNYDIGHVFSTGGGGVAGLGVVCNAANKARGVTGITQPVGDAYYIDYVAHEMGHQFGANHTFNGTTGACGGGNREASAAYEPGSGVTIMAYAGICGAEDQAPHSIDTFHSKSYDEIVALITGSANVCAQQSATGNSAPVFAGSPTAVTIPASTPFALSEGGWSDADSLTYEWEQYDLGAAAPPNTDDGTRPIFRAFLPTTGTSRTFPQLSDILNGTTTFGESLPTTTRTMHFRMIARDNKAGGGGVDYVTKTVNVTNTAGPFAVTAPGAVTWTVGTSQPVTWNVAGTTASPVSCANVDITLSTDGGLTFPVSLAAATPNDGTESITVPSNPTAQARVKVACTGNVFFNISPSPFTVQVAAGNTAPTLTPGAAVARVRGSAATTGSVGTASDGQTAGGLVVTTTLVPAGITVTGITNVNGTITAQIAASCGATLGANTVTFQVSDGTLTSTANLTVNVSANTAPTLGNYTTTSVPEFEYGSAAPDAPPVDNGTFTATATVADPNYTGTFFVNPQTGTVAIQNAGPAGSYTVTVTITDNCGSPVQKTFTLNVTAPNQTPGITAGSPVTRQQGSAGTSAQVATVSDGNDPISSLVVSAQSTPTGVSITGLSVNTGNGAVTGTVTASCTAVGGTAVLKVTDPSNASSTANLTVTVNPNTAPTLTYANAGVSVGGGTTVNPATGPSDNGSVANITVGASGAYTGTVSVNPTTGVVTIGNAGPVGAHTITVTATDNCGTQKQATFTLNVASAGVPSITPSGVSRSRGQSASATIATVSDPDTAVGSLVVTVQSAPAGVTVSSIVNTNGTITATVAASCAAALGGNNVVLKVSDGVNESTGNLTVTVTDAAVLTPTNAGPICAGQSLQLNVNTVAGATAYAWTGPGGFTSSQQNPVVPNAQPGDYKVTVTVNGCTSQQYTTTVVATTGCFYTVTPCRVADTRDADGPYGGPALQANQNRSFTLAGKCGIPGDATAVAINVTITGPTAGGDLRVYPPGGDAPLVSTINFSPGQTRANNALVSVAGSPTGTIAIQADILGTVHFILDVSGYIK